MTSAQITKILRAAGVSQYDIVECLDGELSVHFDDLPENAKTAAAMKELAGLWDQSDKGFVFTPSAA